MSHPKPESTMRSQSKGIGSADNSASIRCNIHTCHATCRGRNSRDLQPPHRCSIRGYRGERDAANRRRSRPVEQPVIRLSARYLLFGEYSRDFQSGIWIKYDSKAAPCVGHQPIFGPGDAHPPVPRARGRRSPNDPAGSGHTNEVWPVLQVTEGVARSGIGVEHSDGILGARDSDYRLYWYVVRLPAPDNLRTIRYPEFLRLNPKQVHHRSCPRLSG